MKPSYTRFDYSSLPTGADVPGHQVQPELHQGPGGQRGGRALHPDIEGSGSCGCEPSTPSRNCGRPCSTLRIGLIDTGCSSGIVMPPPHKCGLPTPEWRRQREFCAIQCPGFQGLYSPFQISTYTSFEHTPSRRDAVWKIKSQGRKTIVFQHQEYTSM